MVEPFDRSSPGEGPPAVVDDPTLVYDSGEHNAELERYRVRLRQGRVQADQSIRCLTTTRGHIPAHVVMGWRGMRQLIAQDWAWDMQIAPSTSDGYNSLVFDALRSPRPNGQPWKYFLFLEDDVIVPPDTQHRLVYDIEQGWDAVGALCWNRKPGEQAVPILLGNPDEEESYLPQVPWEHGLQPCRAMHLGCTLVRADIFRDKRFALPWFWEGHEPGKAGLTGHTPDVAFFKGAWAAGYRKFACDVDLKVGHFDRQTGKVF